MKDGAEGKSFVDTVAEHFNYKIHNDSVGASSATRIIRTTKEYFDNNIKEDTFVLIGWGTWEREEWEYLNTHYNVMVGWYKHLPLELQERYKQWELEQDYDMLVQKSIKVHKDIHDFHIWLQQQNIPHVFFNCMYDFQGVSYEQQCNWTKCYIAPYDGAQSYVWYMKNKNYEHDKWYHFAQEAHTEWAHVIIKHIETNDLIH
jgi:hypothetical protein